MVGGDEPREGGIDRKATPRIPPHPAPRLTDRANQTGTLILLQIKATCSKLRKNIHQLIADLLKHQWFLYMHISDCFL